MDRLIRDWEEAQKIGGSIGADPKELLSLGSRSSKNGLSLWERILEEAGEAPETLKKGILEAISRACAWHGNIEEACNLVAWLGKNVGGKQARELAKSCAWLAGGAENAPGLLALVRNSGAKPIETIREAFIWREMNTETENRRITDFKAFHPDYAPSEKHWGEILLKAIKTEGIELKQKEIGKNWKRDKTTRILGESHNDPGTGPFLIQEVEKAMPNTLITVEEPRDGSWAPIMGFLTKIGKRWTNKQILEAAEKEMKGAPAARVAALACAYRAGLRVAFVDIPTREKSARYKIETTGRRRRIAYGDPFDPSEAISVHGGPRALAATILWGYHNARLRSYAMAKEINRIRKDQNVLHIGGALHAEDIARKLAELKKEKGMPEIALGPARENPLLDALGKTEGRKGLTKNRKGPRMDAYEGQSL